MNRMFLDPVDPVNPVQERHPLGEPPAEDPIMTQTEINEAEWADPANWRWGCYSSPRDTRPIVPKPIRWTGWTLNFAQRMAWVWLAALLMPALIAVTLIAVTGR